MKAARKRSKPAADAGNEAQCSFREVADLRLHALHQRRQVGVRARPERMHLLADHGPLGHAIARRRDREGVRLHVADQLMHRVAQRAHQQRRRRDDQDDAEEHQDGRRKPLLAPHLRRESLVQWVQRDCQDHGPGREGQERREDLVAEHGHDQDEAGPDEYVEESRSGPLLRLGAELIFSSSMPRSKLVHDGQHPDESHLGALPGRAVRVMVVSLGLPVGFGDPVQITVRVQQNPIADSPVRTPSSM